jgi:hypothetical protein
VIFVPYSFNCVGSLHIRKGCYPNRTNHTAPLFYIYKFLQPISIQRNNPSRTHCGYCPICSIFIYSISVDSLYIKEAIQVERTVAPAPFVLYSYVSVDSLYIKEAIQVQRPVAPTPFDLYL